MFKKLFLRIPKYLPQILAMLFLAGFIVYAWTEPSSAPPGGNVPSPINVGTTTQYKAGALGIGGVFQAFSDAVFNGQIKITGGSPGADKVLTSDASGLASWQTAAPVPGGLYGWATLSRSLYPATGICCNLGCSATPPAQCVSYSGCYVFDRNNPEYRVECNSGYTKEEASYLSGSDLPYSCGGYRKYTCIKQ